MPEAVREYSFLPLSPVHIGSGESLAPDEYVLDGDSLVRMDVRSLIRAMNKNGRKLYEDALDAGNLAEALRFIRNSFLATARNGRSVFERYRIRLGRGAAREVEVAVKEPERRRKGEIAALQRNPYTGDVVIPGSSVKGAIRTAVLSARVNPGGTPSQSVKRALEGAARGREHERLEEEGLEYKRNQMEGDPFRLVEVSDAVWPASGVRVDRAELAKLGRPAEQTRDMQIHVERLLSQADNPAQMPECRFTIGINEDAARNPNVRIKLKKPVQWEELADACNSFYTNRFNEEARQFHGLLQGDMSRWYPQLKYGDILLRVGRHCHFDSLSVDNFRRGWNVQAGRPIQGMGATRTLCELEGGGRAPFGWIVLRPVQERE